MNKYTYTDNCDNTLTVESNYGDSFDDVLDNNIDEIININVVDEYENLQQVGLSLNEIKNLINYLNELVTYFKD
jgi:hypothetical protein